MTTKPVMDRWRMESTRNPSLTQKGASELAIKLSVDAKAAKIAMAMRAANRKTKLFKGI